MKFPAKVGLVTLAAGALLSMGAPTALAMPIDGYPPPPDCPPGTHLVGRRCVRDPAPPPPPPPPVYPPFGSLDVVRQTTSRDAVTVSGWTADQDAPTTPLTVRITVDGSVLATRTAGDARGDVASAYPVYGAGHGFDVVIPLSGNDHDVCVTAVNTGPGADTVIGCKKMDWITTFRGNQLTYDVDHAAIGAPDKLTLWQPDYNNTSSVQSTLVISNSAEVQQTSSWENTQKAGLELSTEFSGKASFFGLVGVDTKVGVKGTVDLEFKQSGSTESRTTWSWTATQPVAPWRWDKATVALTHYTIDVPYVMSGNFVYNSGFQAAGSQDGHYSGGDANALSISVKEYYNDGTPVPAPPHAVQPKNVEQKLQVLR